MWVFLWFVYHLPGSCEGDCVKGRRAENNHSRCFTTGSLIWAVFTQAVSAYSVIRRANTFGECNFKSVVMGARRTVCVVKSFNTAGRHLDLEIEYCSTCFYMDTIF